MLNKNHQTTRSSSMKTPVLITGGFQDLVIRSREASVRVRSCIDGITGAFGHGPAKDGHPSWPPG